MTDFMFLIEDYFQSYTKAMEESERLNSMSYQKCKKELFSKSVYYGDSYEYALNQKGYSVEQVIPQCMPLRTKWAEENGIRPKPSWMSRVPFRWFWTQLLRTYYPDHILGVTEQIKRLKPKILWVFSGTPVDRYLLKSWRRYVGKIVLWCSCPIDDFKDYPYSLFDLIFSCIPSHVEYFKNNGIRAHHLPHAFDGRILSSVKPSEKRIPKIAFIGNVFTSHKKRISFLDQLSRYVDIDFYGNRVDLFPKDSPIRKHFKGQRWGNDLYSIYGSYLFAVHINIDLAENQCSAKRIFETTGMGTCLLTNSNKNLEKFFVPEKEVVTFNSAEECVQKVKHLLNHPDKAMEIGEKAQKRTLKEHTYQRRVEQLTTYLKEIKFL